MRVGLIRTLAEAEIRHKIAGREVFVGFSDDVDAGKEGSVSVKKLKDDADTHKIYKFLPGVTDLELKSFKIHVKKSVWSTRIGQSYLSTSSA